MTIHPVTKVEGSNSLANLAAHIEAEHKAASSQFERGLDHAVACGIFLLEAKAHPQLEHGQWLPWLREHCPNIPERTAQLYTQLAIHAEALKSATRCGFDSLRGAVAFLAKQNREARVTEMKERRAQRLGCVGQ